MKIQIIKKCILLSAVWLACLLGFAPKAEARDVTSFNDGWEFKKGPFAEFGIELCWYCFEDWV